MSTDMTVLKSLIAVRLDVSIWSARKKLTPADFGQVDLPPEKLASLGSKKICDPEALKIFNTLKSRAVSMLDRSGVRFLGGWAIPESRIKAVTDDLAVIERDFRNAKSDFVAHYDEAVRNWILDNPGWERVIATSIIGVDAVRGRIGFGWQVFQVAPPRKSSKVHDAGALGDEVSHLGRTLFQEVAKSASETWTRTFAGKTEVTQKALSPLRNLRNKLSGMAFVEPRVSPLVDLIDAAFLQVPDKGLIKGAALVMLQGLVCLMRDADALTQHGQMIIDGRGSDDILRSLLAPNAWSDQPVIPGPIIPEPIMPYPTNPMPEPLALPAPDHHAELDSFGLW